MFPAANTHRFACLRRLCLMLAAMVWIGATAQINTERVLSVGRNALYFEDYMLSIQYFNQVIAAKPYMAQPYFLRAVAKINLDDFDGAEADATKAISLNPYLTDAWEVRGVARQNLGKDSLAISDYDHALELLPRNRQLLFNKAMAQMECKDLHGADTTFCQLLEWYPGFDNGYLGRARLRMQMADTVAARADIDKAVAINRNSPNAYIMRADIAINSEGDFNAALSDMDQAIKLQPRMAGLYINRAFVRYSLDDYFGAMSDYDYALQLDPANDMALFNRGLLLAEVQAYDRALDDFSAVLQLNPNDLRSLFNRAQIYYHKGMFKEAMADINRVAEAYPELPEPLYLRASIYNQMGRHAAAERDLQAAHDLARAVKPLTEEENREMMERQARELRPDDAQLASNRFARLLTVSDNADIGGEYNNSAIRGKVQDRDVSIELEPLMRLAFYSSPTELRPNTYYIKEVDDLNATRTLRFIVVVTNVVPPLDPATASQHFKSIDIYNSFLANHQARTVDYLGRALDLMTIRDYKAAIADLERAISLTPDNPLAYMLRAQARYDLSQLDFPEEEHSDLKLDAAARQISRHAALDDVLADYDRAIRLSSAGNMAAWFNKGNVLIELGDFTGAIDAYSRAIEIKPDMGEAYYNRGYIQLKLGNRQAGIADLSKAGELGILPAYNLIKRMSR